MPACLLLVLSLLAPETELWAQTSSEPAVAPTAETVEARRKSIEDKTAELERAKAQLETLKAERAQALEQLAGSTVTQAQLDEASLAVDAARLKLESIELDRQAVERTQADFAQRIRNYREEIKALQAPGKTPDAEKARLKKLADTETALALEQSLSEIEARNLGNLTNEAGLTQENLRLTREWLKALQDKQQQASVQVKKEALEEKEQRYRQEQQVLAERSAKLRSNLSQLTGDAPRVLSERRLLETQIKETEEQNFLLQLRLKAARLDHQIEQSELAAANPGLQPQDLSKVLQTLKQAQSDLQGTERLAAGKREVLAQQRQVISKRQFPTPEERQNNDSERRIVEGLIAEFNRRLEKAAMVQQDAKLAVERLEDALRASTSRSLTARHELPQDAETWAHISEQFVALPKVIVLTYGGTFVEFWETASKAKTGRWLSLLLLELLWLGTILWLGFSRRSRSWLDGVQQRLMQDQFSTRSLLIGIRLLRCNKTLIWLGVGLSIYQAMLPIPAPWAFVANSLILVWLVARLVMGLGYWLLDSDLVAEDQRQPVLYRWLFWSVLAGSLFGIIMLFAYQGFLTQPAQELLGRFFLLFLFLPAYLLLRIQRLLISRMRERGRTTYWIGLAQVISIAVPMSMFASSVLGLVGYVNLAWSVAAHLAIFMLVVFGWLIIRGLLRDLVNAGKNYTVIHVERGLVITQAVINPIYLLLRVALFVLAVWLLFRAYGWGPESPVVVGIKELLDYPLFNIGEVTVELSQAIGSLLLVVLVVLFGRWVRQVTYRWFYIGIEDLGLRNSLAVFTQYSIVLLGLLIALNTLGLDLTTLAIFTGALGIGIGFGLQNIANNFISGLILLMERPIRTADWVTIGNYEGEVSRIGIRSVTVTTWDNQDVIIPNADIISNPFINWTRTDEVVRTVLVIGISYQNDPHRAVEVIHKALVSVHGVLETPEPRVWLKEFADSSVNIRVHYFMNVKKDSRLEIKSQVMFAIWDALKEAGISIPFPQRDIYIKQLPEAASGSELLKAPENRS